MLLIPRPLLGAEIIAWSRCSGRLLGSRNVVPVSIPIGCLLMTVLIFAAWLATAAVLRLPYRIDPIGHVTAASR